MPAKLSPDFLAKRSRLEKWALELARQGLTDEEVVAILKKIPARVRAKTFYDWTRKGRPQQQLPPGDWRTWVALPGRGWGKTTTGAHAIQQWEREGHGRIALVGATAADVRDVMVLGESGILAAYPKRERPWYRKSLRCVDFHKTGGGQAFLYSGEEPERLRGPQHHKGWLDELAAFDEPEPCLHQFKLGLRLGRSPQAIITSTPKSIAIVVALLAESEDGSGRVAMTRGTTFDNAFNLPDDYLDEMVRSFGGTRFGRQELGGEVLEEVDALFRSTWIRRVDILPKLREIVVSIDPAISKSKDSDETGIVVVGLGEDGLGYVLADLSGKFTPDEWAKIAIAAFDRFGARRIIAETNRGGDLVRVTLVSAVQAENLKRAAIGIEPRSMPPFEKVHAFEGKGERAEPVAALYEQGRVRHHGRFEALELLMTTWNPKTTPDSPDRLDALVWGLSALMVRPPPPTFGKPLPQIRRRPV